MEKTLSAFTISDAGGCLCGKIRYQVSGVPNWVAVCHCVSCRRATGALLSVYAGFDDAAFRYSDGEVIIHASSNGVERSFCGDCGSSLTYSSTRWPGEVHILLPLLTILLRISQRPKSMLKMPFRGYLHLMKLLSFIQRLLRKMKEINDGLAKAV